MLKRLLTTILLSVFMTVCAYSAEITVFGNNKKPPKIWGEYQTAQGILVDILKSTEDELGVSFTALGYPWARAYDKAVKGQGGIIGLSKTSERLKIFDFSIPIYTDRVVLVVKKGNEFPFERLGDLKGKTIGVCRGCTYGAEYEKAKAYFSLEEDHNNYSRLMKLLVGRSDAAIINPGAGALRFICEQYPDLSVDDFTVLPMPLVEDPNYLAFSKRSNKKQLLQQFNQVIQRKIDTGEIQSIIDRYNQTF